MKDNCGHTSRNKLLTTINLQRILQRRNATCKLLTSNVRDTLKWADRSISNQNELRSAINAPIHGIDTRNRKKLRKTMYDEQKSNDKTYRFDTSS